MVEEEQNTGMAPEIATIAKRLIELEREYYFDLTNRDTERRKKVRQLVDQHLPAGDGE